MRKKLPKGVIPHTALYNIRVLFGTVHNLHPRLVNLSKSLGFLWVTESDNVTKLVSKSSEKETVFQ